MRRGYRHILSSTESETVLGWRGGRGPSRASILDNPFPKTRRAFDGSRLRHRHCRGLSVTERGLPAGRCPILISQASFISYIRIFDSRSCAASCVCCGARRSRSRPKLLSGMPVQRARGSFSEATQLCRTLGYRKKRNELSDHANRFLFVTIRPKEN